MTGSEWYAELERRLNEEDIDMDPKALLELLRDGITMSQAYGGFDSPADLIEHAENLAVWLRDTEEVDPELYEEPHNLFDMVEALYWAFNDWHGGQWEDTYRVLCILGESFTPSPISRGPEDRSLAADLYRDACIILGFEGYAND